MCNRSTRSERDWNRDLWMTGALTRTPKTATSSAPLEARGVRFAHTDLTGLHPLHSTTILHLTSIWVTKCNWSYLTHSK